VEKNKCFVLMPFDHSFDIIYGTLKNDLVRNGYICNRADEISGSGPIINKVLREILTSRYIIADLSAYNPNVFYELGIAHCFKDAQNILTIKQKEYKVPFDITHLTYIEYETSNLFYLTSTVRKFLSDNCYVSDYYETLCLNGITHGITDNTEQFVEYIHDYFKNEVATITNILSQNMQKYSENDIDNFMGQYESLIREVLIKKDFDLLDGIIKVYGHLLLNSSTYMIVSDHLTVFLNEFFSGYDIPIDRVIQWQTDVVVFLASRNKYLHVCLPWIIEYFGMPKTAHIDLNRHKLERFLLLSTTDEVNQALVAGVLSENQYIRETMADIIGEKKLSSANETLLVQLDVEENYFVMRSILQAISKIQAPNALVNIQNWYTKREEDILLKKYYWIYRHIYTAIIRLDKTSGKTIAKKFKEDYHEYLAEYPI